MVQRAERNGFKAIVLTVDTPKLGRREADIKNKSYFSFIFYLILTDITCSYLLQLSSTICAKSDCNCVSISHSTCYYLHMYIEL